MGEQKDYELDTALGTLCELGWTYLPPNTFTKGNLTISTHEAYELIQSGRLQGADLALDDIIKWAKTQKGMPNDY